VHSDRLFVAILDLPNAVVVEMRWVWFANGALRTGDSVETADFLSTSADLLDPDGPELESRSPTSKELGDLRDQETGQAVSLNPSISQFVRCSPQAVIYSWSSRVLKD
jgi:hypothetical protein